MHKIVLFGPESTGKSWLAERLAGHYATVWVPEYARTYLEAKKKYYDFYSKGSDEICAQEDMLPIVLGQIAREDDVQPFAKKMLFCDTNPLQSAVYVHYYYQTAYSWLEALINERPYDFYLLTQVDVAWQPDPLRDNPLHRESMFALFESFLIQRQLPYHIVTGQHHQRLQNATNAIDAYMAKW